MSTLNGDIERLITEAQRYNIVPYGKTNDRLSGLIQQYDLSRLDRS